jgi:hypothetical protein
MSFEAELNELIEKSNAWKRAAEEDADRLGREFAAFSADLGERVTKSGTPDEKMRYHVNKYGRGLRPAK